MGLWEAEKNLQNILCGYSVDFEYVQVADGDTLTYRSDVAETETLFFAHGDLPFSETSGEIIVYDNAALLLRFGLGGVGVVRLRSS